VAGVIGPLAESRRVLAIDLRGFGWSEAPSRGYSRKQRVRDVLAVMDRLGVARADLVGHDWGAWLAFRTALDHADRVNRIVAISMVHPWPMQRHLVPHLWRWWVTALFEVPLIGDWVLRARPGVTRWLLARDAGKPSVWTRSLLDVYASVAAEPERAKAGRRLHAQLVLRDIPRLLTGRDRRRPLDVPALVLVGEGDALLPPAVATAPRRRTAEVTVRTVPGGHFVVDESPEDITAAILAHLASPQTTT
jgi:pimeloyl-ACP methyl ester carboxylesterase